MSPRSYQPGVPRPTDVVLPSRKERFEDRRVDGTQRKLLDEFFDHSTLLTISRLITQGQFDSLDFPVATGKEGGVFRATYADGFRAVKVYRIANTMFRNLPMYAMEELRRETSARNFGGLIFAWTRREHTILGRMADAKVRSPTPYGHLRNVLVMDFIGNAEGGAPRLRDAEIDDPEAVYKDLVEQIGRMVRDAKLVHGDLSPFNTLLFEGKVVLIDVAQAVSVKHPEASKLLSRDLDHYAKFLSRLGVQVTGEEFFHAVGGDRLKGPSSER
ncbi:MAG: serine protein kinase RIO [Thermoplasmata archaeon]|nr:serine protein kinase RIO [Thermoplasmata archaeon]